MQAESEIVQMMAQLAIFIIVGGIAWILSHRCSMADYKTKPVEKFDKIYVFFALGMIGLYGAFIAPFIMQGLTWVYPGSAHLRDYFTQQPLWIRIGMFILVTDFFGYWAHRALHYKFIWPYHSLHHSVESVNWVSGVRGSPIHYLFVLTPAALSSSLFLYEISYLALIGFYVFDIFNQHLCHSNVRLPYAKQIEYVLVTPRMHFVHHNPDVRYTDTNFGLYFTFWDRLFGTYVDADNVTNKGQLGLEYSESKWSAILGLDNRQPLQ
jgi:sterol desaturase/sphingolipid hydroxylase (fatty acid hydroxylase superfamily)